MFLLRIFDLQLENILMDPRTGMVKLLDFGLAFKPGLTTRPSYTIDK